MRKMAFPLPKANRCSRGVKCQPTRHAGMMARLAAFFVLVLGAGCIGSDDAVVQTIEFDYCYEASISEAGMVDWAIRGCPVELFNKTLTSEAWIGIELPARTTGLLVEAFVLPFPGHAELHLHADEWEASLSWAAHVPLEDPAAVMHAPAVRPTRHAGLASLCDRDDLRAHLDVNGVFPTVDLRIVAYVDTVPEQWPDDVDRSTCNGYWTTPPILD